MDIQVVWAVTVCLFKDPKTLKVVVSQGPALYTLSLVYAYRQKSPRKGDKHLFVKGACSFLANKVMRVNSINCHVAKSVSWSFFGWSSFSSTDSS